MDHRKCHCGSWLARVKGQGIFDETWLDKLEKRHDNWHALAYELRETYLTGSQQDAMETLNEFEQLYERMQELVANATQPTTTLAKRAIQPDR